MNHGLSTPLCARLGFALSVLALAVFHAWQDSPANPHAAGMEGLLPGAFAYVPLALAGLGGLLRGRAGIRSWHWWLVAILYVFAALAWAVDTGMVATWVTMADTVLPLALLASVVLAPAGREGP